MLTIAGGIVLGFFALIAILAALPWVCAICSLPYYLLQELLKPQAQAVPHAGYGYLCSNPELHSVGGCDRDNCRLAYAERYGLLEKASR